MCICVYVYVCICVYVYMCICVYVYMYMYTWMRKKAYNSFPKPKASQIIRDTPAANEDSYPSWIYVHNLWSSIQFLYFIVWKPSTWVSRCFPPFFLEVLLVFPMRPHPWFQFVKCQQLRQVGMVGPDSALGMCLEIWQESCFGFRSNCVDVWTDLRYLDGTIHVEFSYGQRLSCQWLSGCCGSGFHGLWRAKLAIPSGHPRGLGAEATRTSTGWDVFAFWHVACPEYPKISW